MKKLEVILDLTILSINISHTSLLQITLTPSFEDRGKLPQSDQNRATGKNVLKLCIAVIVSFLPKPLGRNGNFGSDLPGGN